jgi:citrate lyase subunit beta/citryl-CoA lyase
MRLRSLLFVPGDSARKAARGAGSGADALILDLEDAVAPENKVAARAHVAALLAAGAPRDWQFWVRVNAFDTDLTLDDLAAVVVPGLDGIVLPKAEGARDVERLGHHLDALEAARGLERGRVRILVVATETPAAMFVLGSYAPAHPRLAGLTWGAEDLSAALGASGNKDADGRWRFPYLAARAQCLFAAAAAGVLPIDTLFSDFRDPSGLADDCRAGRADGFAGRLAIHPDQVPIINDGFRPSDAEVAAARRLVAAFAAQPGAGTIGLDGRMVDIPHLKAARRVLSDAGEPDGAA